MLPWLRTQTLLQLQQHVTEAENNRRHAGSVLFTSNWPQTLIVEGAFSKIRVVLRLVELFPLVPSSPRLHTPDRPRSCACVRRMVVNSRRHRCLLAQEPVLSKHILHPRWKWPDRILNRAAAADGMFLVSLPALYLVFLCPE